MWMACDPSTMDQTVAPPKLINGDNMKLIMNDLNNIIMDGFSYFLQGWD